jgi:hypothetical protein
MTCFDSGRLIHLGEHKLSFEICRRLVMPAMPICVLTGAINYSARHNQLFGKAVKWACLVSRFRVFAVFALFALSR